MKRGPYYKTISAIGHPIRTARRGTSGDLAEIFAGFAYIALWAHLALLGFVVLTAPLWVPVWLVIHMFEVWHPAVTTICLIVALAALVTCRELYLQWREEQDPDPQGLMREAIRQEKLREQREERGAANKDQEMIK